MRGGKCWSRKSINWRTRRRICTRRLIWRSKGKRKDFCLRLKGWIHSLMRSIQRSFRLMPLFRRKRNKIRKWSPNSMKWKRRRMNLRKRLNSSNRISWRKETSQSALKRTTKIWKRQWSTFAPTLKSLRATLKQWNQGWLTSRRSRKPKRRRRKCSKRKWRRSRS